MILYVIIEIDAFMKMKMISHFQIVASFNLVEIAVIIIAN